jgi:hypothetical protein
MANALAVLVVETELPISMTCAEATAIPKGTVLALGDPATVIASTAHGNVFGGIAAEEKIAGDGKTKIACYFGGIFKMESGTAGSTVGKLQVIDALNEVVDYTTLDDEKGCGVGKALETATNGETFLVFVGKP